MTQTAEKLFSDAMSLDESEREELAAKLMGTLDSTSDPDYTEAWKTEIAARIEDVRTGRVKAIPLDQAMKMIRSGEMADDTH